jgi:hypothetical protein
MAATRARRAGLPSLRCGTDEYDRIEYGGSPAKSSLRRIRKPHRSPTQNSHLLSTTRYQLTGASCIVLHGNSSLPEQSLTGGVEHTDSTDSSKNRQQ